MLRLPPKWDFAYRYACTLAACRGLAQESLVRPRAAGGFRLAQANEHFPESIARDSLISYILTSCCPLKAHI